MDIYQDPMLSVTDAARYLAIPASTLATWRREHTVHSQPPKHHGWPTLPFVGVIESFVLRSLREAGFTMRMIREAAEGVRREFNDDYGLARPQLGHDGAEIFLRFGGDLFRARDRQQVIRETVDSFSTFIEWQGEDPLRLKLKAYDSEVILDPRFGWGRPVVARNKVPLEAILGLWHGGDSMSDIATEFQMRRDDIERIIQSYDAAGARAA